MEGTEVLLDYTNWRGERASRIVKPITGSLRFAETPHHKPAQWVFDAWDLSKLGAPRRTFALAGVHAMTPKREPVICSDCFVSNARLCECGTYCVHTVPRDTATQPNASREHHCEDCCNPNPRGRVVSGTEQ
jgi:hypothetical protein